MCRRIQVQRHSVHQTFDLRCQKLFELEFNLFCIAPSLSWVFFSWITMSSCVQLYTDNFITVESEADSLWVLEIFKLLNQESWYFKDVKGNCYHRNWHSVQSSTFKMKTYVRNPRLDINRNWEHFSGHSGPRSSSLELDYCTYFFLNFSLFYKNIKTNDLKYPKTF